MPKLTLADITSGYNLSTVYNDNNALIEAALENTLSRDGTDPNEMLSDLDMNSNRIINCQDGINPQDVMTVGQGLGMVLGEGVPLASLDPVDITAPAAGEVLTFNGTDWTNELIELDDLSNVTVPAPSVGDVLTWNGTAWVDSPPTPVVFTLQEEGVNVNTNFDTIDFVGDGVTVTDAGSGVARVTIPVERIVKNSTTQRVGNVFGIVPAADPDLVGWTVTDGATYLVDGVFKVGTGGPTGDIYWYWNCTGTVEIRLFHQIADVDDTVDTSPPVHEYTGASALGGGLPVGTINMTSWTRDPQMMTIKGYIVCTGTGTLNLHWSPSVNNAVPLTIYTNSSMALTRIV